MLKVLSLPVLSDLSVFVAAGPQAPGLPPASVRPPLPPYHVVMQNAQGTTDVCTSIVES